MLKHIGSSILHCGDKAKGGALMKLVGNFTFMSYVETVSEAMALADAGGLPRNSLASFLDRIFPGFVTKGTPAAAALPLCQRALYECGRAICHPAG